MTESTLLGSRVSATQLGARADPFRGKLRTLYDILVKPRQTAVPRLVEA